MDFRVSLAQHAAPLGWSVGVVITNQFARSMYVEKDGARIHFSVRVSNLQPGFWGIPVSEVQAIVAGVKEHNILLTSAGAGYFLSSVRLPALTGKFSRSEDSYKVNEETIRRERHFASIAELWSALSVAAH